MANPEFHFHPPNKVKRVLEKMRLYEVTPHDILPPGEVDALLKTYPDLAGDQNIGRSDFEGRCQSWRGYPQWWLSFTRPK